MRSLSRRSALALGVYTAGSTALFAQSDQQANVRQEEQVDSGQEAAELGPLTRETVASYWNRAARALVAFDHSFVGRAPTENVPSDESPEEREARRKRQREEGARQIGLLVRAPGPVATARALGIIHGVLADAMLVSMPDKRYTPWKETSSTVEVPNPKMFVGGATSSIMNHIYSSLEHANVLLDYEAEFIRRYSPDFSSDANEASWQAGQSFAESYFDLWDPVLVRELIDPQAEDYKPQAGEHDVDPANPSQGFYGQRWGSGIDPLVIDKADVETACPAPPDGLNVPRDNIDDVAAKGELRYSIPRPGEAVPITLDPSLTAEQRDIGLFWAYDGARAIGTPPRFFNQIIAETVAFDGLDEIDAAYVFALCNLALSDAGNAAWYAKYAYKIQRPILGIRNHPELTEDRWKTWTPHGAPRTNRPDFRVSGPDFLPDISDIPVVTVQDLFLAGPTRNEGDAAASGAEPAFTGFRNDDTFVEFNLRYSAAAFTPNFPAYPSGHATFGSACLRMLEAVRNDLGILNPGMLPYTLASDEVNGQAVDNFMPTRRRFSSDAKKLSFEQMIQDNNNSRIFLGVHWKIDATSGDTAGQVVVQKIKEKGIYSRRA